MFEPERFGKYMLLDKIATGGMAEVYKAKSYGVMGFEKLLVIKKILPHLSRNKEFVSMFINEAKVSVSMNHANVVQVYDVGVVGNDYYIAMEYIHGSDLMRSARRGIQMNNPMSIPLACFIVGEMARGLDYAHNLRDPAGRPLNVVHRDISPHNVLVSYEGDVKLVDFGIAQVGSEMTEGGGVAAGKYAYMSPEHLGVSPVDPRSDIYSTGIVLFEMVTGSRLYAGMSVEEKQAAIINGTIPKPSSVNPGIPPALEQIIFTALARDPQFRFQTALDLQEALIGFLYESQQRVNRITLGSFLKEVFAEEYQRDASAGSVINNFEPEFDGLAGSQPDTTDRLTGGSQSRTLSKFTASSGSSGASSRRRWTSRKRRGSTNLSEPSAQSMPARRKRYTDGKTDRPSLDGESSISSIITGTGLDSGALEAVEYQPLERLSEGERREVYVLAADVVGFDGLSGRLEEEDLLRYNYRFLRSLVSTVRRYNGALDRFYNDRFLVFWGLGRTEEHDQDLCLDCAAELAQMRFPIRPNSGVGVRLCIGVHRGTLVAGAKGRRLRRFIPVGDTLKLATRFSEAAEQGVVMVSDRVATQASDKRNFQQLDPLKVKGRKRPLDVYRLRGVREAVGEGTTSGVWISRSDEIGRMAGALDRAEEGETVTMLVLAEPGSGKTRFLQEVRRRSLERGFSFLLGKGRFHKVREPLQPIADIMRQIVGVSADQDLEETQKQLSALALKHGLRAIEKHLLGSLLGIEFAESKLHYLSSDQRVADLFKTLTRLLIAQSQQQQLVVAVQSLASSDRLTRQFIRHLHNHVMDAPIVIAVTSRADKGRPIDLGGDRVIEISLPGWGAQEIRAYCKESLGVSEIPGELVEYIHEATGGNALYAKELLRGMLRDRKVKKSGDRVVIRGRLEPSVVPDSVQDLIKSRIDALGRKERLAIEVGAVIGRQFSVEVLYRILQSDRSRVERLLDAISETDLIRSRTGKGGGATCQFRNLMTWEVTYRGITAKRRRELHARVGDAIEKMHSENPRPHYEMLANHFKLGGLLPRAAKYAELAGINHAENDYTQEALRSFQQAVLLLRGAGAETDEVTVGRRLSGIYSRMAALSVRAADMEEARRHGTMALDYATDVDAIDAEAQALRVLCRIEQQLGHEEQYGAYLERLDELSGRLVDTAVQAELREELAIQFVKLGDHKRAEQLLDAAVATARKEGSRGQEARILCELGDLYLKSRGVMEAQAYFARSLVAAKEAQNKPLMGRVLTYLAITQLRMEAHSDALKTFEKAYRLRKSTGDRTGMAHCLHHIGDTHMRSGDMTRAARYFRRSQTMASENGWEDGVVLNELYIGYLRTLRGSGSEGRSQMKRGLEKAASLDELTILATGQALLAKAMQRSDQKRKARELEDAARETAREAGDPALLNYLPK